MIPTQRETNLHDFTILIQDNADHLEILSTDIEDFQVINVINLDCQMLSWSMKNSIHSISSSETTTKVTPVWSIHIERHQMRQFSTHQQWGSGDEEVCTSNKGWNFSCYAQISNYISSVTSDTNTRNYHLPSISMKAALSMTYVQ